jgi:hypothetical protein
MKKRFVCAALAAAAIAFLPADVGLAQNAPDAGKEKTTETPSAAPAPAAAAPTATAPATTTPTTTAPPTAAAPAASTTDSAKAPRKKKVAKMTRQQEIDRSLDRGTVPARYRSSVPKEYQQYIPFDKR